MFNFKKMLVMLEFKKLMDQEFNVNTVLEKIVDSGSIFLSWGVIGITPEGEERLNAWNLINKGLLMKVNGFFWKDFVLITKNRSGFVVRLTTKDDVKVAISNLTLGDIVKVIDERIEKLPSYRF